MAEADLSRRIASSVARIERRLEDDRGSLRELVTRTERDHLEIFTLLDDLKDHVESQGQGIMRLIDRLGPADPPGGNG